MVEAVIEVKDLVKKYGQLRAVDGIGFQVYAGEVFSILGPNGAGKTTTVEMMECVRKPTAGSIKILGYDVKEAEKRIKQRIGVIPQDFSSTSMLTVEESIQYFADLYERSLPVDELIAAVDLGAKRDEYFKNLSGGLKQRVGIAISLVNDPDIVFLDEPTTGLDPKARREVWDIIRDLKSKGKTVILTTHYMEEAEALSDRIAIMNSGRFMAYGTPGEIIEEHGGGSTCIVKGASEQARTTVASLDVPCQTLNGDLLVKASDRSVLPKVVRALESNRAPYDELLVQKATLEDVFLRLTGRRLDEDGVRA
jgi:ABC-2 type transport system ATP-binding protein